MRHVTEIEKLIEKIDVVPGAEMDKRTLGDALAAHNESRKQQRPEVRPNTWRITMKSRITKLAAAAVIIVAVLIGVYRFDGSLGLTGSAFAEISEAVKKMPCIHWTEPDGEEQWVNHDSQVWISKDADGVVRFVDYEQGKKYEYDPPTNAVAIYRTSESFSDVPPTRWEEYANIFAELGAKVLCRQDQVGGKNVSIYKVSRVTDSRRIENEVTVDTESDLPLLVQSKVADTGGTVLDVSKVRFEFPEEPPTTMYDVGVPRSAAVFDYSEELLNEREESALMLRTLGVALVMYADEHNNKYPETLQELEAYADNLEWFTKNVEYLGKGKSPRDSARDVIAYDKTLLEKGNSTNILFCDIALRFGVPKRFIKQEVGH